MHYGLSYDEYLQCFFPDQFWPLSEAVDKNEFVFTVPPTNGLIENKKERYPLRCIVHSCINLAGVVTMYQKCWTSRISKEVGGIQDEHHLKAKNKKKKQLMTKFSPYFMFDEINN